MLKTAVIGNKSPFTIKQLTFRNYFSIMSKKGIFDI